MFLFLHLTRRFPRALPALILSTASERSTVNPCPAPQFSTVFARERHLHTKPAKAEVPQQVTRKIYTNKDREEVKFWPYSPAEGHKFVPAHNIFMTRRCRDLAHKVYAVYGPKNLKKRQTGLYVPGAALEQAHSDFKAKRAKIEEKLTRDLDKRLPHFSLADKNFTT